MSILKQGILNRSIYCITLVIALMSTSITCAQNQELLLAKVKKNRLYGIIDTKGQFYIPNQYNYIGEISEGFAQAVFNNIDGFIHLKTRTFIPFEKWNLGKKIKGYENKAVYDYTFLYAFLDSNDTIYKPYKKVCDTLNNVSLFYDTVYKPNYTFVQGVAPIWIGSDENLRNEYRNGKWGYIKDDGNWLIDPTCDVGRLTSENQLFVFRNNQASYFDIAKDQLISLKFSGGDTFNEGFACVGIGDSIVETKDNIMWVDKGRWGYIDKNYKVLIPLKFDLAFSFSNGYARVQKGNKYGFINKNGEIVIPYTFIQATDFANNRAGVKIDSLWGVINKKGDWIRKPSFKEFFLFSRGLAVVEINNQQCYINTSGKIVIQEQFEYASSFENAYVKNCINCLNRVPIYDHHLIEPVILPDDY